MCIEGRNALLRDYAEAGKVEFHDAEIEKRFWQKLKDKRVLDVTVSDPKRIARHFAVSPWQRWIQELDSQGANKKPASEDTAE